MNQELGQNTEKFLAELKKNLNLKENCPLSDVVKKMKELLSAQTPEALKMKDEMKELVSYFIIYTPSKELSNLYKKIPVFEALVCAKQLAIDREMKELCNQKISLGNHLIQNSKNEKMYHDGNYKNRVNRFLRDLTEIVNPLLVKENPPLTYLLKKLADVAKNSKGRGDDVKKLQKTVSDFIRYSTYENLYEFAKNEGLFNVKFLTLLNIDDDIIRKYAKKLEQILNEYPNNKNLHMLLEEAKECLSKSHQPLNSAQTPEDLQEVKRISTANLPNEKVNESRFKKCTAESIERKLQKLSIESNNAAVPFQSPPF